MSKPLSEDSADAIKSAVAEDVGYQPTVLNQIPQVLWICRYARTGQELSLSAVIRTEQMQ